MVQEICNFFLGKCFESPSVVTPRKLFDSSPQFDEVSGFVLNQENELNVQLLVVFALNGKVHFAIVLGKQVQAEPAKE